MFKNLSSRFFSQPRRRFCLIDYVAIGCLALWILMRVF